MYRGDFQYLSTESSALELPAVLGRRDFPHSGAKSAWSALLATGFPSSHTLLQLAVKGEDKINIGLFIPGMDEDIWQGKNPTFDIKIKKRCPSLSSA